MALRAGVGFGDWVRVSLTAPAKPAMCPCRVLRLRISPHAHKPHAHAAHVSTPFGGLLHTHTARGPWAHARVMPVRPVGTSTSTGEKSVVCDVTLW